MNDIIELEGRIASALGRIRRQVDAMTPAAPTETVSHDAEEVASLTARLDEERTANAQLEERVKALKDRQDSMLAGLASQAEADKAKLATMDVELQRLQAVNAELRAVASEMRKALQDEVADAELVNRAAAAELEAVSAARDADRVEVDAILSELAPLIGEGR